MGRRYDGTMRQADADKPQPKQANANGAPEYQGTHYITPSHNCERIVGFNCVPIRASKQRKCYQ
jgi:hypothetical protein